MASKEINIEVDVKPFGSDVELDCRVRYSDGNFWAVLGPATETLLWLQKIEYGKYTSTISRAAQNPFNDLLLSEILTKLGISD